MANFKKEKQEQAKFLYFTTNKTQKTIAQLIKVSEKAMSVWVRKGNWAALKKEAYYSPEQEVQHLYEELRTINANIKGREPKLQFGTKEELEAKAKILALISGPLKNTTDSWRNLPLEMDIALALAAGNNNNGEEKFSTARLHDYYIKVASAMIVRDGEDVPENLAEYQREAMERLSRPSE